MKLKVKKKKDTSLSEMVWGLIREVKAVKSLFVYTSLLKQSYKKRESQKQRRRGGRKEDEGGGLLEYPV